MILLKTMVIINYPTLIMVVLGLIFVVGLVTTLTTRNKRRK
jgi:hypothetical protein